MTTDQPLTAGGLCGRIACRIEGDAIEGADTTIYAYGGHPGDAIMVGAEHVTTVLAQQTDGRQRCFRVEVTEFDQDELEVWQRNHAVLLPLRQRATGELGPLNFRSPRCGQ